MLTRAKLWDDVSNGPNFFTYTDLVVGTDTVHEVTVRVQKPNVPFQGTMSAVEVELTRVR